jgi:hypothetical protein
MTFNYALTRRSCSCPGGHGIPTIAMTGQHDVSRQQE